MVISLVGQTLTGWHEHNEEINEYNVQSIGIIEYLFSGHFYQATFENWESEFLQMGIFIWLTTFLRQKGSSESKSLDEKEEVENVPVAHNNAPWPVRKSGYWLKFYKKSLTLTFLFLFIISFVLHFYGSLKDYNKIQVLGNQPIKTAIEYLGGSRFWFESFQNWQSEFLSVISIVLLTIYLRQQGSPESKPVDAPNDKTGK